MSTLNVPIQIRRGTAAQMPASMLQGELYFQTDTDDLYCGTGISVVAVGGGSAPSGAANLVYATPNGSSGSASLRALVAADIPNLSSVYDVAGLAATAQSNAESFATSAVATETSRAETAEGLLVPISAITGRPNLVLATNPSGSSSAEAALRALVAADIPTLNQNTSGTAGGLSGTPSISVTNLTVSGTTSFGARSIAVAALAADTIALTDSTGLFTITGSPATLGGSLTLSAFAAQTANLVLRSGSGTPSFSALIDYDLPATNPTGSGYVISASNPSTLPGTPNDVVTLDSNGNPQDSGILVTNFIQQGLNTLTGGLTLQAGNTSLPFVIQNTAAATSISNKSTMFLELISQYWSGSSSQGKWSLQGTYASGTNPLATLVISYSGSPGGSSVSVPALTATTLNVSGASAFAGSGTSTVGTATPGTSLTTAGFELWQNTTPTVTGAATTVALSTTTAPTNGGSGSVWTYTLAASESGAGSNAWVGASVTTSGWTSGATGNNGTFTITASTTTTVSWTNTSGTATNTGTPVMISSAVVNSPILQLAGTVNTGTAGTLNSAADSWSIQNVIGSVGPNPTSTLTFTHSGSSGTASVSVPSLTCSVFNTASNNMTFANAGTIYFEFHNGATFSGGSATTIGFSAAASPTTSTPDTAISRVSAGVLAIGTGAQGNAGGFLVTSTLSPTSASTAGVTGQWAWDATNLYICTVGGSAGSATWKKVALSSD